MTLMTASDLNPLTTEIVLYAATNANLDLGGHADRVAELLNERLDNYPYGWSREEVAREIGETLAASGVAATADQAWEMAPIVFAWLAGEVIAEDALACCSGEHYDDPGEAYVHTRCRRLLQPWGDVHPHPLCACYGKPAQPKVSDGGTYDVIDIT
jgi:hypothetical protein